jgi:NAD(P)H-hydrate repair Nnr-like enzyme with NAD(P)H-hydrate dehydratase domain
MAALMDCDEASVTADHARRAALRFGATVVLKASDTWIATPDAPMLHYRGGGPGLATGGSGDVLSGIIGGLLARGAAARDAAAWGVWLHGEAGRRLADRIGPLGFLARELLPVIPALMRDPQPEA